MCSELKASQPNTQASKTRIAPIGQYGRVVRVFVFVLACLGLVGLWTGCFPEPEPANDSVALYHEAWRTVKLEYLDDSFNGQQWERWKHRYDSVIEEPEDAYVAIETMVASLNDDYTRFLKPRGMDEQTMQIDSHVYGVGIQIMVKDKKLMVVATLPDTPAEEAGLLPLDEVTHINGESAAGISVQEAADKIRGPEGTFVELTVRRVMPDKTSKKPKESSFSAKLRRAEIKIKTVFTKSLENDTVGYIRLNSFISEQAPMEMQEAIDGFRSRKALILDLRGNYGGLLTNAVDIADMFLAEGKIVSIEGRRSADTRVLSAKKGNEVAQPLVVLIDGGSASASEILSGAIQDHHRGVLIGTKSFGKGLVQKINPLSNGSGINITISRYLTPKGTDINKKGILPDVTVPLTHQDVVNDHDVQLEAALKYLKEHPEMMAKAG